MQSPGRVYGRGLKHFIPGAGGSSAVHPERAPLTPSMSSGERAGGTALFGRCSSSTPSSMLSGVGITGLPLAERSQGSSSEQPRQQGALARCKTATSKIADISMSITGKDGSFDWAAKQKDDIQPAVSGEEAQGKLHSNFLVIEKMVAAWEVQERAAESKDPGTLLQTTFAFSYKNREYEGQALHVLALYKGEAQNNLMGRILHMRADVEAECACSTNVCVNYITIQAIHLAAGSGNVPALKLLLDHNADVNVRATRKVKDGADMVLKPHYTALNDAVYHDQVDAVRILLDYGADANIPNYLDQAPLHLAVEQGFVDIAKALLKGGALLDVGPSSARRSPHWQRHVNDVATKLTPLRLACECGRFPHHSLFLLSNRSLGDLIEVAGHNPEAALDMIHDEGLVHPVWRDALVRSSGSVPRSSSRSGSTANFTENLSNWCALMKLSPRAAVALLDSVTTAPEVTNANRHSLYRRAIFPAGEDMRCFYNQDATWDCDSEARWPEWHDRLAPQSKDLHRVEPLGGASQHQVIVKIKRLELRGVIHYRLLHTLAGTADLTVFGSLPVQAIVKFAWDQIASRFYYHYLAMKVVEMCALIGWVVFPTGDARRKLVWGILLAAAGRDVYREICEMNGYIFLLKKSQEYFGNVWNAWDWLCIVPLLVTIVQSGPDADFEEESVTVAVTAFTRWLQLCYFFRAVSCTGRKLLPIIYSFAALGGISLITIFVFLGFLHSFLALGSFSMGTDESIWTYILNTCRLLFMGDGDGIDFVLQLGGGDSDGNYPTRVAFFISVFLFCVCILNLFIAVHSEAYDAAQQEADVRFIQQRADICFSCFLRPHWPPKKMPTWLRGYCTRRFDQPGRAYWVIIGMGVCLWYVLMTAFRSLHPAVPSTLLLGAMILADTVDLQRPWDCEKGSEHSLWICHRADFDPGVVVRDDSDQNQRLDALQNHSSRHFKRIDKTIAALETKLHEVSVRSDSEAARQFQGLGREVRDLGGRMSQLEGAVGALAPAVRELVEELQRRRVDEAQSIRSQASAANGLTSSAGSHRHHRFRLADSPDSRQFN